MGRKKPAEAERDKQQRDFNTWRLLVRHPDFRKDLAFLKNRKQVPRLSSVPRLRRVLLKRSREVETIADKWGLSRFPPMALYPFMEDDPRSLERCYLNQGDQQGPYPVTYPIVALTELKENRFLHGWMDTSQPVDAILAAFEAELREFYRATKTKGKRGRPNDLDFQLKVFDLVNGTAETPKLDFKTAARKLKRSLSTVRNAYGSICRKIGIADKRKIIEVPETNPGPISECPDERCREAQTVDDFCKTHRAWCDLDEIPLREFFGPDISSIEHAQASSGRKKPLPSVE